MSSRGSRGPQTGLIRASSGGAWICSLRRRLPASNGRQHARRQRVHLREATVERSSSGSQIEASEPLLRFSLAVYVARLR